jgi:hypothetical protein
MKEDRREELANLGFSHNKVILADVLFRLTATLFVPGIHNQDAIEKMLTETLLLVQEMNI